MQNSKVIVIIGLLAISITPMFRFYSLSPYVSSDDFEWIRTYGGADDDWANCIIAASDGGYAIAGATCSFSASGLADSYLIKIDSSGTMLWNKTYGEGYDDGIDAIVQTSDGGYAMAGYSAGVTDDVYFVKADSSGNKQWSKTFRWKGNEFANSLVQTSDGGYVLAGYTDSFSDSLFKDAFLIRLDSSGNRQWTKIYGGPWNDVASSVILTNDGCYAMAGSRSSASGVNNFWLVKIDPDGNELWNKTYGRGTASSVIQTTDGEYLLAGHTGYSVTKSDAWLIKTDTSGNMLWNRTYGGAYYVTADSGIQTADSGYALAGTTKYFGASYDAGDAWLVKTDNSGNMQWRKTYGGTRDEWINSFIQADDGSYLLAGWTRLSDSNEGDIYLVKTVPNPIPVHEISAMSLDVSKTIVGESTTCKVNVTVLNRGDFIEKLNVTTLATNALQTRSIQKVSISDLPPDEIRSITVVWNTTGWEKGNYSLSAYAEPVLGEANATNNLYTGDRVFVTISGDVDGNRVVDILDAVRITRLYLIAKGDWKYAPNVDVNESGVIDDIDVLICKSHYGQEWS